MSYDMSRLSNFSCGANLIHLLCNLLLRLKEICREKFVLYQRRESKSKPCLPLRVIKVSGTCCCDGGVEFETPSGWSFHVMSHTWTPQIKDLVSRIQQLDVTGLSYNDACRQADFRSVKGYKALKELLQLLKADGVEEIWIDALCINQADRCEKNREIPRMGEYYGQSKGCYVSTHGIGGGYNLLGSNSSLPRWFGRVWILQEFILSKSLTFIVEGLDELTKWRWNRLSERKSSAGMCKCVSRKEFEALRSLVWSTQLTARAGGDKYLDFWEKYMRNDIRQWCADLGMEARDVKRLMEDVLDGGGARAQELLAKCVRCSNCDSYPLLRRLEISEMEAVVSRDFYMVDREAYLTLAVVFLTGRMDVEEYAHAKDLKAQLEDSFLPYMPGQGRKSEAIGKLEPWFIVEEIRKRQCEREEDRVLGVLGLLEVGSNETVETGKTLDEQVLNLAQWLKNQGDDCTLVNLCVVDEEGYGRAGMSWAPNFVQGKKLARDLLPRTISQSKVEIVGVTAAGLRIVGGVCCARFVLDDEDEDEQFFLVSVPGLSDDYKIELDDCDRNNFVFTLGGGIHLGGGLAESHNGKLEFEPWLLLLGSTLASPDYEDNVVLICTSTTAHESMPQLPHLQKMGFIHTRLPTHLFIKQEVLIGGVGKCTHA